MHLGHILYLDEKDLAGNAENKEKVDWDCFRYDVERMLYQVELVIYTSPKGRIIVIKDRDKLIK